MIDVDEKGVPVSIDIHSLASSIVDLTKLEAEGPIFGLVRRGDSDRRVRLYPKTARLSKMWEQAN